MVRSQRASDPYRQVTVNGRTEKVREGRCNVSSANLTTGHSFAWARQRTKRWSGWRTSGGKTNGPVRRTPRSAYGYIKPDASGATARTMGLGEINGPSLGNRRTAYFGFLVNLACYLRSALCGFARNGKVGKFLSSRIADRSLLAVPSRGSRVNWRSIAQSPMSSASVIGNSEIRNPLVRKGSSFPINGPIGNAGSRSEPSVVESSQRPSFDDSVALLSLHRGRDVNRCSEHCAGEDWLRCRCINVLLGQPRERGDNDRFRGSGAVDHVRYSSNVTNRRRIKGADSDRVHCRLSLKL